MSNGMSASIAAVKAQIESDAKSLSLPAIQQNVAIEPLRGEPGAGAGTGFRQIIDAVNAQDQVASDKMAAVDAGRSDDLVGAMLASQEASLSFTMLMQARNKIVGAMEDLIKLQL